MVFIIIIIIYSEKHCSCSAFREYTGIYGAYTATWNLQQWEVLAYNSVFWTNWFHYAFLISMKLRSDAIWSMNLR